MTWRGKHKYNAQRCEYEGINFASKSEKDFYIYLQTLQKMGQIKILELQPKVYLTDAKILYKPDFLIKENNEEIFIDVKGMETPVFKLKKKLWKFYGQGKLRLVKKSGRNFKVIEEVSCS